MTMSSRAITETENNFNATVITFLQMDYMKNRIFSFRYAFRGVSTFFRETPNARIQPAAETVLIRVIATLATGILIFQPRIIRLLS